MCQVQGLGDGSVDRHSSGSYIRALAYPRTAAPKLNPTSKFHRSRASRCIANDAAAAAATTRRTMHFSRCTRQDKRARCRRRRGRGRRRARFDASSGIARHDSINFSRPPHIQTPGRGHSQLLMHSVVAFGGVCGTRDHKNPTYKSPIAALACLMRSARSRRFSLHLWSSRTRVTRAGAGGGGGGAFPPLAPNSAARCACSP